MPLIYGEGRKAFLRLQNEIMRFTTDQSLFAWGTLVKNLQGSVDSSQELGMKTIDWVPPERRKRLTGLIAETPHCFGLCGQHSSLDSSSVFLFNQQKVSMPILVDNGIIASFIQHGNQEVVAHY